MTVAGHHTQARIRKRLAELIEGRQTFDLIRATLLVAAEEYRELDIEAEVARIRAIRRQAARRADGLGNPFARLDAVRVYLFEDLRFRGDFDHYDDPRNSFLNQVLDRRTGIPLTLSILFIEAARAAGFEARGIDLPGHYVAGVRHAGRSILVDPFHGGQVITEEDCRHLVARATGRPSRFRREQLEGATPRATLRRMLLNLKRIYLGSEDHARALSAVERLLLISPDDPQEIRDRGFLLAHLGRTGAAAAELETYLSLHPGAPDAAAVRGRLAWLRRRMSETR